jgi:tetraacyldisaccharide 4'-kinase
MEIFNAEYVPVSVTVKSSKQEHDIDYLSGKKLCAVAGVGDNNSFFRMLVPLCATLTAKLDYSDHHKYSERDIVHIVNMAKKANADAIITTSKDWIRLRDSLALKNLHNSMEFVTLNINIRIIDEKKFTTRIHNLLNR